jgi:threonine synthase
MDILISSNLERFLFELTGHDADRVTRWFGDLMAGGSFTVDGATRTAMNKGIAAGWADDKKAFTAIGRAFSSTGYILDTHTAVAVAVDESLPDSGGHTVIDATASPYKFSSDVYEALTGNRIDNEFECINRIHALGRRPIHRGLVGLREKPVRHDRIIALDRMSETVAEICNATAKSRCL